MLSSLKEKKRHREEKEGKIELKLVDCNHDLRFFFVARTLVVCVSSRVI
jgi:hypothetical protein